MDSELDILGFYHSRNVVHSLAKLQQYITHVGTVNPNDSWVINMPLSSYHS